MKGPVTPLLCIVFISIFTVKSNAHEQETLHRDSKHRHANFVEHRNTILDVQMIKSVEVFNTMHCAVKCLGHDRCVSYNSAVFPGVTGKFECQLLAIDQYRSSNALRSSKQFHHYSIKTPCEVSSCQNGGTCRPCYETNQFKCHCPTGFTGTYCQQIEPAVFTTKGNKGRSGHIQEYIVYRTGRYKIQAAGAKGGTHKYNYEYKPGTYYGGKGAVKSGTFRLTKGTVLKIVVGQRGGDSVEVKGGQKTTKTAAELGLSVEDNAGTGGGGGSFVYTSTNTLLIAAGGGGGASGGYHGVDGRAGRSGANSVGRISSLSRAGGSFGQPGVCNSAAGASYHGGVGAGWLAQGCPRLGSEHGERGGSRDQGWVGGRAGGMNSGQNGGPPPGAVGGFGGGGGGGEDNGASGGGGGYSGGGSGTHANQAGGGGGSYCGGESCSGVDGGNNADDGFVKITLVL